MSHKFPIRNGLKQGDALSPVFFKLYVRARHWEGSGKPGWLETKWYTSPPRLCRRCNILGRTIHTLKENEEALVAATREIGLEVSLIKLSTRSCLEIRMQDEFTV